jgi:hypothetical protein
MFFATVAVAQLVEPWIVIPVVVGSSPISHPIPFLLQTIKLKTKHQALLHMSCFLLFSLATPNTSPQTR